MKEKEGWCSKWASIFMPLVVALVGAGGLVLGHSVQQSLTTIQLRAQREQGDTTIRAELFKAITDRLFPIERGKDGNGSEISADRDAVLAELLALNFHEQIELKPLMVDIENRLDEAGMKDMKEELRSVARRVRNRQTAMLVNVLRGNNETKKEGHTLASIWGSTDITDLPKSNLAKDDGQAKIRYFTFIHEGDYRAHPLSVTLDVGQNGYIKQLLVDDLPDGKRAIYLSLDMPYWERQEFVVSFNIENRPDNVLTGSVKCNDHEEESGTDEGKCKRDTSSGFQYAKITWFDLPLTDNTLDKSGVRYAVFIDSVYDPKDHPEDNGRYSKAVKLGLLYFPKDFIPSRERPENYTKVRKHLGL